MRNFVTCDQIKDNDIGGACSTHGRDEKYIQDFGRKILREETTQKT